MGEEGTDGHRRREHSAGRRWAVPAEINRPRHVSPGFLDDVSRKSRRPHVQGVSDQGSSLLERLVEEQLLETPSYLLPLLLRDLGQLFSISVKTLVEDAHDEERPLATARSGFSEILKEENILSIGMECGEL